MFTRIVLCLLALLAFCSETEAQVLKVFEKGESAWLIARKFSRLGILHKECTYRWVKTGKVIPYNQVPFTRIIPGTISMEIPEKLVLAKFQPALMKALLVSYLKVYNNPLPILKPHLSPEHALRSPVELEEVPQLPLLWQLSLAVAVFGLVSIAVWGVRNLWSRRTEAKHILMPSLDPEHPSVRNLKSTAPPGVRERRSVARITRFRIFVRRRLRTFRSLRHGLPGSRVPSLRMPKVRIPAWEYGRKFRGFLGRLLSQLPTGLPPALHRLVSSPFALFMGNDLNARSGKTISPELQFELEAPISSEWKPRLFKSCKRLLSWLTGLAVAARFNAWIVMYSLPGLLKSWAELVKSWVTGVAVDMDKTKSSLYAGIDGIRFRMLSDFPEDFAKSMGRSWSQAKICVASQSVSCRERRVFFSLVGLNSEGFPCLPDHIRNLNEAEDYASEDESSNQLVRIGRWSKFSFRYWRWGVAYLYEVHSDSRGGKFLASMKYTEIQRR